MARAPGCVEATPTRRGGFAFTNELWAQLSDLGGNVAALHRQLSKPGTGRSGGHVQRTATVVGDAAPRGAPGAACRTCLGDHSAPARPGRSCRVRPRVGRARVAGHGRRSAFAALLPGAEQAETADEADPAAQPPPLGSGARLYVPGAHVVSTRQLGAVTEALAHTVAARGIMCVYGDPGQGKTVAVHQALCLLLGPCSGTPRARRRETGSATTARRAARSVRPARHRSYEPY